MGKGDNRGFSLTELIIVIAIMAVLVGVLAPQYLKYVNNAKVNTDISNANAIADCINIAIANSNTAVATYTITGTGGTAVTGIDGLQKLPACRVNASYGWKITVTQTGVTRITLNDIDIYPGSVTANAYYTAYHNN